MHQAELDRIADALGQTPPITHAAAHVYPAAAPAFEPEPRAEREPLPGDRLRLYVHLPFCNYKCSFCYYATRVGDGREAQERYVAALEHELDWIPEGVTLTQLFVGGGTPTALPADLLARVLGAIFERVRQSGQDVHTVEASPESLSDAHLDVLAEAGIGRISMGVQSLDDEVLGAVHRRHGLEQTLDACDRALEARFLLNVDLMYGLPGQSQESFRHDLETVAARGLHSVTLYDLRTTRRNALGRALREEERLDLAHLLRWRRFVAETAQELGFVQTRWHTWKRREGEGWRHERAPCFEGDGRGFQLGVGMSARSHLGYAVYRNHQGFAAYLDRIESGTSPVEHVFRIDEEGRRTQYVARTLGDGKPLERRAFAETFGYALDRPYGSVIERLLAADLLAESDGVLTLTELGRLVYDRVMLNFYPKRALDWLWSRA